MAKFTSDTAREAGQKSKRGEAKLTKLIREAADKESATKVFLKLQAMAVDGDMDAIKTYLAYVIGKPKESMELSGDIGLIWQEMKTYETQPKAD